MVHTTNSISKTNELGKTVADATEQNFIINNIKVGTKATAVSQEILNHYNQLKHIFINQNRTTINTFLQ